MSTNIPAKIPRIRTSVRITAAGCISLAVLAGSSVSSSLTANADESVDGVESEEGVVIDGGLTVGGKAIVERGGDSYLSEEGEDAGEFEAEEEELLLVFSNRL
jgi:hypothetical protein